MKFRPITCGILFLGLLSIATRPLVAFQASDPTAKNDSPPGETVKPSEAQPAMAAGVKPKPISTNTQKGIEYLVELQDASGGWGQGGGWRQSGNGGGRVEGNDAKDQPDLGNTCIATLALIRAGNTPQTGPYAKSVARAVAFICEKIEQADKDSLYVTDVRDTQLQVKIGPYVDTFLAGLVLSELKGKMPADNSDKRLLAALDKTVAKIERNQKADGTFAGNTGWASVLSQGLCSKFINRAAQNQVAVKADALNRDFSQTVAMLDKKTGDFKAPEPVRAAAMPISGVGGSDAGVKLYNSSSNASRLNDLNNTSSILEQKANATLVSPTASVDEKSKAKDDLAKVAEIKDAQQAAFKGILRQLDDKQFIAGFGNNGGEEFLSYMNISEMLVVKGGPEWQRWDQSIAENLNRVQNKDGSWSGDHCITGRTFCTSAALLTLLADRAPVPLSAKIQDKKSDTERQNAVEK